MGERNMTREEFVSIVDEKIKLIRNEKGYTQDKMAEILGISKKTLVQVEKRRSSLGWAHAVVLCTIFRDSEVLQMAFGGDPQDIILTIAFNGYENNYYKTMGGKLWWKEITTSGNYKVQKNIISQHYRILDKDDRRILSSFEEDYIYDRLKELNQDK